MVDVMIGMMIGRYEYSACSICVERDRAQASIAYYSIDSSALTIMHSIDSSSGSSFPPEECTLQRLEVEALKDGEIVWRDVA